MSDAVFADAKTLVTVEFPSKILDLRDRVDSVWLSLSNLSHIRDMAVESTRLPTAGNAEDEGQDPAEKRQKMDRQMHVPCNETLVEVVRMPDCQFTVVPYSVVLKLRYKKPDVEKTPFNLPMKNISFQSPEVLSNRTIYHVLP